MYQLTPIESQMNLVYKYKVGWKGPFKGLFGVETSINSENTVKATSFFDFEVEKSSPQAAEIEQLFYPPELMRVLLCVE